MKKSAKNSTSLFNLTPLFSKYTHQPLNSYNPFCNLKDERVEILVQDPKDDTKSHILKVAIFISTFTIN